MDNEKETGATDSTDTGQPSDSGQAPPQSADQRQAGDPATAPSGPHAPQGERDLVEIRKSHGIILDPGEPGQDPFQQFQPPMEQQPAEPPPAEPIQGDAPPSESGGDPE